MKRVRKTFRLLRKSKKKGFTLVELLIAISIIGVIIAILLGIIGNTTGSDRARAEKAVEQARQIAQATEAYYTDNGQMPGTLDDLVTSGYLKSVDSNKWTLSQSIDFDGDGNSDTVITSTSNGGNVTQHVCEEMTKLSDYGLVFKAFTSGGVEVQSASDCDSSNQVVYLVKRGT